jgi:hypothetical protein
MNDVLLDIRNKLVKNFYQNEEHVRLSLVARILYELDWDIWNPLEVNTEFRAVPQEDSTKVDIALFRNRYLPPSVFIEIKAVGKVDAALAKIEHQLRDYNRNNTAEFSIITDGRKWRFYYSQTGGEFSRKCFKVIDVLNDELTDLVETFNLFLSKSKIDNGDAKNEAERLLQLNQKQRALEDAFPKAKRMISEPPFPSLPEALVKVVSELGFHVTLTEASKFAAENIDRKPTVAYEKRPNEIQVKPIRKEFTRQVKASPHHKLFPPDGTQCRFKYKGNVYTGAIVGGWISVDNYGNFSSFSAASKEITKTSRNGWRDWELKLPDSNEWILADTWRSRITGK